MTLAYVGIGANQDQPRDQVTRAIDELGELPRTRVTAKSSLYRSAPLGRPDQPDFVNAVAELDSALSARELLAQLQNIEARHGRLRSFANAPRTLDLDLLLYGDEIRLEADLTLPHPRMHERAFVLRPLLEIAPALSIPGRGPAQAWSAACAEQVVERMP